MTSKGQWLWLQSAPKNDEQLPVFVPVELSRESIGHNSLSLSVRLSGWTMGMWALLFSLYISSQAITAGDIDPFFNPQVKLARPYYTFVRGCLSLMCVVMTKWCASDQSGAVFCGIHIPFPDDWVSHTLNYKICFSSFMILILLLLRLFLGVRVSVPSPF